ncbi:MAG: hypothetical protein ACRDTT_30360, partial [Pseudonocardiaceae bacterium]
MRTTHGTAATAHRRTFTQPRPKTTDPLHLQRVAGNRAVATLLSETAPGAIGLLQRLAMLAGLA